MGGAGKRVDGVFPGRPQIIQYQRRPVDTEAQDEGEWRKTTEPGAKRFMAKWIPAEKVRAGCSSMPGRDGKDRGEDSPKQACSSRFALFYDTILYYSVVD